MTRQELEQITIEKLKEIREAFVEYVNQYPELKDGWDDGELIICPMVKNDNVGAFSMVKGMDEEKGEPAVYVFNYSERFGDEVKGREGRTIAIYYEDWKAKQNTDYVEVNTNE